MNKRRKRKMNKKWWKSRTLIVAGVAFVAIVLAGTSDGQVSVAEIEAAIMPILMVILRLITNKSIGR